MKRPQEAGFPAAVPGRVAPFGPLPVPVPVPVPVPSPVPVLGAVTDPGPAPAPFPAEKKIPAQSFLKTPSGNSASARFQ